MSLTDMIVVVPGILGSVLKRDGANIWNPSAAGFLGKRLLGCSLDGLRLDLAEPPLQATDLIRIPFGLRGLMTSKGYDLLVDQVCHRFDIDTPNEAVSNLHEFPYDWRQDNRESAKALAEFVKVRLDAWRKESGSTDAHVIFLAHSIGGLVCRYFLEVLGGWKDCRLLVTFATPHRGAIKAIEYLLDGYKVGRTEVGAVMRTFPSVYQLLPTYPSFLDGKTWQYPKEVGPLRNVDACLLDDAAAFHKEINDAVARNRISSDFGEQGGYALFPVVGTHQPTLQRAWISNGGFLYNDRMPDALGALPRFGDGTVPQVSAIPLEMSDKPLGLYIPDHHAFLHANETAVDSVLELVETMQSGQLSAARGLAEEHKSAADKRSALSLECFEQPDAIEVVVALHAPQGASGAPYGKARVALKRAEDGSIVSEKLSDLDLGAQPVRLRFDSLTQGLYEVEVRAERSVPDFPPPVHDLAEVA